MGSSKTCLCGILFHLVVCSDCRITSQIFVCFFCYSGLKCENGQWFGFFWGWLVGFFGKEYMRNLKVMNIEGKKNYLPMCT